MQPYQSDRYVKPRLHGRKEHATPVYQYELTIIKIFELLTGRTPFEARRGEIILIAQFQKVIGGVPEEWLVEAIRNGVVAQRPDGLSSSCSTIGLN
jgi:hypothetical protein